MDSSATSSPSGVCKRNGGGMKSAASGFTPEEPQKVIACAVDLVDVHGARRIDMLRTYFRTITDGRAAPDTVVRIEHFHPLSLPAIARILVVAVDNGDQARADKVFV